jgi:3',5'-cyclic AMP phosphodiesterase CpdA
VRRTIRQAALLVCIVAGALLAAAGCGALAQDGLPNVLPDTYWPDIDTARYRLVARIAHLTDAQIVDEESPGRLASLGALNNSAWRPHERYSLHLLDGMIRAVNAYHQHVAPIDFLIHTGDALDNVQLNELHWFLDCFDGRTLDPLSGVDDRAVEDRGPVLLDPHAPFRAEGLYRSGIHGDEASIPWYAVMGNHDRYAIGVLPVVPRLDGGLMAPLPGGVRLGLFLPVVLVPDGPLAYGAILPASVGPLPQLILPSIVTPNPDRRFVTPAEFTAAHFDTLTGPPGHGFAAKGRTWYADTPVPGLRLIVLDTSLTPVTIPGGDYHAGGLTSEQVRFLRAELEIAQQANELVVLATHHPSADLSVMLATTIQPAGLQGLLYAHPQVVVHLAGHSHRPRVTDRGNYLEVETSAIIDAPQEGRIIEIWRATDGADGAIRLRYAVFSHLYTGSAFADLEEAPTDPLLEMRRAARALAEQHAMGLLDAIVGVSSSP